MTSIAVTDGEGKTTLWLFPRPTRQPYSLTAKPAADSGIASTTLSVEVPGDVSVTIILEIVHQAPTTTASVSGVQNQQGAYLDSATITLSASAIDGFKVVATYYTIDGGQAVTYADPFAITADGVHTITFWSTDSAGVRESAKWLAGIRVIGPAPQILAYWDFNDATDNTKAVDVVNSHVGVLAANPSVLGNYPQYTADGGGFSGKAGDQAIDFGVDNGNRLVQCTDICGVLNAAAASDKMSVSFWQKWNTPPVNSSTMWFISPSSAGDFRGLQSHCPWGNSGSIYFDTAGGWAVPSQRLQGNPSSGFNWQAWNNFVYVKNGAAKQVWIDGTLVLAQSTGALPLPTDFTQVNIGLGFCPPGYGYGNVQALVDDFAIYQGALGPAAIASLALGFSPSEAIVAAQVDSKVAEGGENASVSTAPTTAGATGVAAQVQNRPGGAPIEVTAVSYASNPTGFPIFDVGGGFVDLKITGADESDSATASFYYPSTVTGELEASLTLLYFNGTAWVEVMSSSGVKPVKDTTDISDGIVAGGRFDVVFDGTSVPKITQLGGTVFAAAGVANAPPVVTCPGSVTVEYGTSTDPSHTGTATATDDQDPNPVMTYADVEVPGGCQGTKTITRTWTATDRAGKSASCVQTIKVVDTTPPTITSVAASPNVLWPPNHKMVPVKVTVSAADNCGATVTKVVSVSCNEPVIAPGSGQTSPDWQITGDLTVSLRAERSGPTNGRIYTISVQCTDTSGNISTATVAVTVPHDQGK
jgi:hypothetical protein